MVIMELCRKRQLGFRLPFAFRPDGSWNVSPKVMRVRPSGSPTLWPPSAPEKAPSWKVFISACTCDALVRSCSAQSLDESGLAGATAQELTSATATRPVRMWLGFHDSTSQPPGHEERAGPC